MLNRHVLFRERLNSLHPHRIAAARRTCRWARIEFRETK